MGDDPEGDCRGHQDQLLEVIRDRGEAQEGALAGKKLTVLKIGIALATRGKGLRTEKEGGNLLGHRAQIGGGKKKKELLILGVLPCGNARGEGKLQ